MKTFWKVFISFLFFFITYEGIAQTRDLRPKLFNSMENKVSYPRAELERIFTRSKGNKYEIALPGNFKFSGIIVSTVQRYDNLKSFLIRSDVLNGAIFAVSKRTNEDNSISYTGRIINEKYSDGYELKVDEKGNYFLNKINMDELLPDRQ